MTELFAVSYGAFGPDDVPGFDAGTSVVVLPVKPSVPLALSGAPAMLWKSLVGGRDEGSLSDEEKFLVESFVQHGVATRGHSLAVVGTLAEPWLSSPMHELVYSLLASLTRDLGIDAVFLKGPMQHAQGLRTREHSGDIDIWVKPGDRGRLCQAMSEWGWNAVSGPFTGTLASHSQTLVPHSGWGCAIDIHTRFPGMALKQESAFMLVYESAEYWNFGGVNGRVPERSVSAVVRALHDIRPRPASPPSEASRQQAYFALMQVGPSVISTAEKLGATAVLGPLLQEAYPNYFVDATKLEVPPEWHLLDAPTKTEGYRRALGAMPIPQRAKAFFRVVWPENSVAMIYARSRGYKVVSPTKAKILRLRDGVREALSVIGTRWF